MLKPRLNAIAYPGRLSRLLADQRDWSGIVLVSEAYTCRSYARLLTHKSAREVTVGLGATVPVAAAAGVPVSIGGDVDVQWHTDSTRGDWKSAHHERVSTRKARVSEDSEEARDENEHGKGHLCYPLFKLVALRRPRGAPVSAVRGALDYELPVAVPPWMDQGERDAGDEDEDQENEEEPSRSWWKSLRKHVLPCVECAVRVTALGPIECFG